MKDEGTILLVVVLVAFLFLSGTLSLSTPLNQRPQTTGNPGPAAGGGSALAGAGVQGGIDLATGNYVGAGQVAGKVLSDPRVQAGTGKAAVGAFHQLGSSISSVGGSIARGISSLNPF